MTTRMLRSGCIALGLIVAGGGGFASAQTIGGQFPAGPAVSPYLNLMRPGTPGGINYFNLVQPQMQFQSAISNLQQNQLAMIPGPTMGNTPGGLVTTGHSVSFGNYARYFPGATGGGGLGGVGGFGGGAGPFGGLQLQRTFQYQRLMYSPLYLGGYNVNSVGGVNIGGGINPGVNTGFNPAGSNQQVYPR